MNVTITIPTLLKKHTDGLGAVTMNVATVRDILDELIRRFPGLHEHIYDANGQLQRYLNVFVNGLDVRFIDSVDTALAEGDDVQLVPAIAGGLGDDSEMKIKGQKGNGHRQHEVKTDEVLNTARYARQIVLDGMGVVGQRRLAAVVCLLHGDPSLVEPAASYLRAAGVGSVTVEADGHTASGGGSCTVRGSGSGSLSESRTVRAIASRDSISAGKGALAPASPLASETTLEAAGLMLAIESLKAVVGIPSVDSWIVKTGS